MSPRFRHLKKIAEMRAQGKALPWDDPAWQERIKDAKKRAAEHEASPNSDAEMIVNDLGGNSLRG